MSFRTRRRLHLADPSHCAGEVYEGFKGRYGFLAAQGDATEPFEFVEEALDEMALFVEHPVDWAAFAASWIALDVGGCAEIIGNEGSQVIGVIGGVHNNVLRRRQTFNQATRLRAVAPLTGCNRDADRQAKRIDSGMYFGGQAAFGTANTGSFKPPF